MNKIPLGYDAVEFPPDCSYIKIINQAQLPQREEFILIRGIEELTDAVKTLKVRGAPALGVFTAAGIALLFRGFTGDSYSEALSYLKDISEKIVSIRPTAVNSKWAANRILQLFISDFSNGQFDLIKCKTKIAEEAVKIKQEDIGMSLSIAENAINLLNPKDKLLTICNAGHLATARFGTALAPIYLGEELGYSFMVYVTETRPLLQGARLTAFELSQSGIEVTLICDNMISALMKKGEINAVLTGCDRIAANGDVANKIGTSSLAILAKYYQIPFYVLGPESTIDKSIPSGSSIVIEERDGIEITEMWYKERMAPDKIKTFNPAFDITDSELVTAIVTNKGIYKYPFDFSCDD